MIEVILYSRKDCHLCDQAKNELDALQEELPHNLTIVDVDGDPKLKKQYGLDVPIVTAGPYHVNAPITKQDLIITLRAAWQRERQIIQVGDSIQSKMNQVKLSWSKSDQFSDWLSKHYLALFNFFIGFYVGMAFLAPMLMKIGAATPAMWIYRTYGVMCHQLAFRSFFLFGEQLVYPRSAAGVEGILTYGEATGLDENNIWEARKFIGNEITGYKVGLCQRDVAIYSGIFLFGLVFALTRRQIKSLNWAIWLLLGIVPIGLDGLSQLVSQFQVISWIPLRESTPVMRAITGLLFGFVTAWFGYPLVEESMRDTQEYLESKRDRLRNQISAEVMPSNTQVDRR